MALLTLVWSGSLTLGAGVSASTDDAQACVPHPPIHVEGDEGDAGFVTGLDALSGDPVYRPGSGVIAGTGAPDDPYVIAGWCIVAQATYVANAYPVHPGILIQDTTSHVVVRDNTVVEGAISRSFGFLGWNASNITLQNNLIIGGDTGIYVSNAHNVSFIDNTLREVESTGIEFLHVNDTVIRGNALLDTERNAMVLHRTQRALVADNVVDGGLGGIADVRSVGNTYRDNHVAGTVWGSLAFHEASGLTVTGNALEDGGMTMTGTTPAHYDHHEVAGNTYDGEPIVYLDGETDAVISSPAPRLFLVNAHNVTLRGLETNGIQGLTVAFSSDVTVEDSVFAASRYEGVELVGVSGGVLQDNAFIGNWASGVRAGAGTHNVTISDNAFEGNGAGVRLDGAGSGVHVVNNTFTGDRWGVYAARTADGVVEGNLIQAASNAGIRTYDATRLVVKGNTITDAAGNGMFMILGGGHLIEGNHLLDNSLSGVRLYRTHDNVVQHNAVRGNERAGIQFVEAASRNVARWNVIHDNLDAGLFWSGGPNNVAYENNVVGNGVGAAQEGDHAADARENWWGCAAGPGDAACDQVEGLVDASDWLTAPYADAGP